MAKAERLERYQQLMNGLKLFDINDWRNAFLADLKGAEEFNTLPSPTKQTYHKIVNY